MVIIGGACKRSKAHNFIINYSILRKQLEEVEAEELEKVLRRQELQEDEGEADHPFKYNHYEDSRLLHHS
jgi:hypothetical protein